MLCLQTEQKSHWNQEIKLLEKIKKKDKHGTFNENGMYEDERGKKNGENA